jgi:predicted transcriptional regulator
MNYTCAYYKEGDDEDDLRQAQINKMDLVARKLKLKPGMRCLDLGSGFGTMAKHLATKYGVSVVGYNSTWNTTGCFVVVAVCRCCCGRAAAAATCRRWVVHWNDETPPTPHVLYIY